MEKRVFFVFIILMINVSHGKNYRRARIDENTDQSFEKGLTVEAPVVTQMKSWSSWQSWSSWSSWQSWSSWDSGQNSIDVKRVVVRSFGGTGNGADCAFPFKYGEQIYTSCTSDGRRDELRWCATTTDYDKDQLFGFCFEKAVPMAVTTSQGPCSFPFIFNRKVYYGCTSDGAKDKRSWCSLNWDYDGLRQWAHCPHVETFEGNSNYANCSSTYTFQGKIYEGCTTDGRTDSLPWCATTNNYDVDGKWGFCVEKDYPKSLLAENRFFCAFPFIFREKIYYQCTTEGRTDGRKWCSLTHDYGKGRSWSFCPTRGN